MIKLPKEIGKGKFVLKQYARKGKYALYELWLKDEHIACRAKADPPEGDVVIGYEVIIIRRKKACEIMGTEYPAKEIYPSPEEWGRFGWTYNNFRDANAHLKQLENCA